MRGAPISTISPNGATRPHSNWVRAQARKSRSFFVLPLVVDPSGASIRYLAYPHLTASRRGACGQRWCPTD